MEIMPMTMARLLLSCSLLVASIPMAAQTHGAGPVLIAYGGFNETVAPMWVGVDKGLFKKHGIDAHVLQTRSGQIMMATLATGGASLVWAAPSSALNLCMMQEVNPPEQNRPNEVVRAVAVDDAAIASLQARGAQDLLDRRQRRAGGCIAVWDTMS